MLGSSLARRTSDSGFKSSVEMIPRMAPTSRSRLVTARVSMASTPNLPLA